MEQNKPKRFLIIWTIDDYKTLYRPVGENDFRGDEIILIYALMEIRAAEHFVNRDSGCIYPYHMLKKMEIEERKDGDS